MLPIIRSLALDSLIVFLQILPAFEGNDFFKAQMVQRRNPNPEAT
jgi:hypothetical protein